MRTFATGTESPPKRRNSKSRANESSPVELSRQQAPTHSLPPKQVSININNLIPVNVANNNPIPRHNVLVPQPINLAQDVPSHSQPPSHPNSHNNSSSIEPRRSIKDPQIDLNRRSSGNIFVPPVLNQTDKGVQTDETRNSLLRNSNTSNGQNSKKESMINPLEESSKNFKLFKGHPIPEDAQNRLFTLAGSNKSFSDMEPSRIEGGSPNSMISNPLSNNKTQQQFEVGSNEVSRYNNQNSMSFRTLRRADEGVTVSYETDNSNISNANPPPKILRNSERPQHTRPTSTAMMSAISENVMGEMKSSSAKSVPFSLERPNRDSQNMGTERNFTLGDGENALRGHEGDSRSSMGRLPVFGNKTGRGSYKETQREHEDYDNILKPKKENNYADLYKMKQRAQGNVKKIAPFSRFEGSDSRSPDRRTPGRSEDVMTAESERLELFEKLNSSPYLKRNQLETPEDLSYRLEHSEDEIHDVEKERRMKNQLMVIKDKVKNFDELAELVYSKPFQQLAAKVIHKGKSDSRDEPLSKTARANKRKDPGEIDDLIKEVERITTPKKNRSRSNNENIHVTESDHRNNGRMNFGDPNNKLATTERLPKEVVDRELFSMMYNKTNVLKESIKNRLGSKQNSRDERNDKSYKVN